MVPFSFPQPRLKSRVMKRYLTDKYWMMGSMDFWINGSSVTLDSIVGKRESREDCEVWNSQLLSPKFRLRPFARFKPVLKGFKPIYTIQGTLFLSHAERQGLSSEAPAKGDWRFRVSTARVFDAGARRTTAGAAVLPKTKMGARLARTLAPPKRHLPTPNFQLLPSDSI
jgi:hypothetical protein